MADVFQRGGAEGGLLFFLPDLQPLHAVNLHVETGVVPEPPQPAIPSDEYRDRLGAGWSILCDPLRRLAWYLVGPQETRLSAWQVAAAAFLPAARLSRARALLRRIEDLERRGLGSEEHWKILEQEWRWVSNAPAAKRFLMEQARKLDLPEPESSVASVLNAVQGELLQILRLRSYFIGAGSSRTRHLRALLRGWKNAASTGVVDLYIGFLCELSGGEPPADHAAEAVAHLLANTPMARSTSRRLQAASGQVLTSWFARWMQDSPTQLGVELQMRRLHHLERAGHPHLLLFELLSALYLVRAGKVAKSSPFDQSIRDIGKALAYDPFNRAAREQLENLSRQIQKLEEQVPNLSSEHRANAAHAIGGLRKAIGEAEAFVQTPEGRGITARRGEALESELAVRMGLDLDDAELHRHIAALARALQESAPHTKDKKHFAYNVTQLASAASERLASVDWNPVVNALRKNPFPSIEVLALTLPQPAPLSRDPRIEEVRKSAGDHQALPPATALPARWRRWLLDLGTWLFSPRDAWAKAAAGAGLALLLFAGIRDHVQGIRMAGLETAYRTIHFGVQQKDDALVLSSALPFLRQVGGTSDPRAQQVQDLYQKSLLREVVRLVEAGAQEQASALLQSSEPVLPPGN